MTTEEKILAAMRYFQMLEGTNCVVLGVSGGSDSMALLHFLATFFKNGQKIIAAHVNYGLRGAESGRDEATVSKFCKKSGVELKILRVDLLEKAHPTGIEALARDIRYGFFEEVARPLGAKIATAHTLSDSVETMIFNLARGTGPTGLCGIVPVRDSIIRPLIYLTKRETENYCARHGVPFEIDSTNFTRAYSRNKIRLDVVPTLKEINPGFEAAATRAMAILAEDNRFLGELANKKLLEAKSEGTENTYDAKKLASLPLALKSRCVKLAAQRASGSSLQEKHVKLIVRALEDNNGTVNFAGDWFANIKSSNFEIFSQEDTLRKSQIFMPLCEFMHLTRGGKSFIINSYEKMLQKSRSCVDLQALVPETLVRTYRANDRFCPAAYSRVKLLKKFFCEKKVPPKMRKTLFLLANGSDVLWAENFGPAEMAKISSGTKEALDVESLVLKIKGN